MQKTHRGVRTTIEFPEDLWTRARIRAIEERTDFRVLVIEGLEMRLAKKGRKGGRDAK
jgi:hypothetical protein